MAYDGYTYTFGGRSRSLQKAAGSIDLSNNWKRSRSLHEGSFHGVSEVSISIKIQERSSDNQEYLNIRSIHLVNNILAKLGRVSNAVHRCCGRRRAMRKRTSKYLHVTFITCITSQKIRQLTERVPRCKHISISLRSSKPDLQHRLDLKGHLSVVNDNPLRFQITPIARPRPISTNTVCFPNELL